jgi:histidinol phosphatase-like enzyme
LEKACKDKDESVISDKIKYLREKKKLEKFHFTKSVSEKIKEKSEDNFKIAISDYEADICIAKKFKDLERKGEKVVIVSNDSDMLIHADKNILF